MLRLLADENLDVSVARGLVRRVRVRDVGLTGADDPTVPAWAAEHGRVSITHDVEMLTRLA